MSWGFEDMLPAPDANPGSGSENKGKKAGRLDVAAFRVPEVGGLEHRQKPWLADG